MPNPSANWCVRTPFPQEGSERRRGFVPIYKYYIRTNIYYILYTYINILHLYTPITYMRYVYMFFFFVCVCVCVCNCRMLTAACQGTCCNIMTRRRGARVRVFGTAGAAPRHPYRVYPASGLMWPAHLAMYVCVYLLRFADQNFAGKAATPSTPATSETEPRAKVKDNCKQMIKDLTKDL